MTEWRNFYDPLGLDEGGLPVHLPMGVTEDGRGPEDDDKAHHYVCWCMDPTCPLTNALRLAHEATERRLQEQLKRARNKKYDGCAWCCAGTPPEARGEGHSICRAP